MMNRRQPHLKACVALVVAYALAVSALVASLAPMAGKANPLDGLSISICLSSGGTAAQDKAPDAPTDRQSHACCILCMVPGLTATSDEIRVSAPEYQSSRSSPPTPLMLADSREAAELAPIIPRAPPRLT